MNNHMLRIALAVGLTLLLVSVLGFSSHDSVPVAPTRTLLARDQVALAFAAELIEVHYGGLDGESGDDALPRSEAERDRIMQEAFSLSNAFLREKDRFQGTIRDSLLAANENASRRNLAHWVGDPHAYFDNLGRLQTSNVAGPYDEGN